jgi:branched-chain amino acid transport system ATP-binding protein
MLLEVTDLSKRFGGLKAADGITFTVDRGEILGLIGPNGSGKSTVMNLIMGVLKPDSGSIRLNGKEIGGRPPNRIAEHGVSMVFQHSRPLHQQTVLQNLYLALLPNRLFNFRLSSDVDARAHDALKLVGLEHLADRKPSELPFAGLRRLELAKSLVRTPSLLLLDEPFAGLSASEMDEFSDLIRQLRSDERAIILVDHNVRGVRALVDRVVAMSSGQKIADGLPDHVLADPQVREVYLGKGDEAVFRLAHAPVRDTPPALQVENVSVRYGEAIALDDVSLDVPRGGVTAVVGLNGAGKTSLFNAICGIIPAAGIIRYGGQVPPTRRAHEIARSGVVLCPETRELFTDMTVQENLRIGGNALGSHDRRRQMDLVESLFPRLAERRKQFAKTLSGGEQQQLAIGRALMMKPSILLIDEPTLGLAPIIFDAISNVIERLRESGELSLFLAEQNLTFALRHADLIHVLEHGKIKWSGPVSEFDADSALIA